MEGCAGVLVSEHDRLVHDFCARRDYLPSLDSSAGDQRGSWVSRVLEYGGGGANRGVERASVVVVRVSEQWVRQVGHVVIWTCAESGKSITAQAQSTGSISLLLLQS